MKRILTAVLAIALFLFSSCWAFSWPGTVVDVVDGDTIIVARVDGAKERIRLFGVDCPEKRWKGRWNSQPFSQVATKFVKEIFANNDHVDVAIWEMGVSYERIVGGVIILDNGTTLQEELVKAGLAWVDPLYCKRSIKECVNWFEMQREAAEARRGLWQALDWKQKPVAPWVWRGSKTDR